MLRSKEPGDFVEEGTLLARIIDPCTNTVLEELHARETGRVFFAHKPQLIGGHEVAFRICKTEK